MDKIARIRQEIERRLNILTNVYAEQVERKDEEMMNYYHGKVIALEELRPFLDTLSEEPDTPEFPETFEICLYDGRTPDKEKCTECSTTCSVKKEEPDKSLEEAAEEYASINCDDYVDYDSNICYIEEGMCVAFKAGAEWQASQMPMPEDTVLFNKGVAEGRRLEREDMLKDAVEVTVQSPLLGPPMVCCIANGCSDGDRVRIVVLKAEEE